MGPIGVQEMIGIFLVALLLFGPKKLPELGRIVGKGLREFRRMKSEVSSTFESHMRELEREAQLSDAPKRSLSPAPDYSSSQYSYPYEESVETYHHAYEPPVSTPAQLPEVPVEPTPLEHAAVGVHTDSAFPVNGAVPRSNGVQPIPPSSEGEHPA